MNTILACTDFSAASRDAALYAAHLAKQYDAKVLLFHVDAPRDGFNQAPVMEEVMADKQNALGRLNELAHEMSSGTGGATNVSIRLESGDFFAQLFALCREISPYVVIFGSQGTTAAERFLLGSNSVHAMKNLPWPLITVPLGAIFRGIRKIALASDFNQVSESFPLDRVKRILENTRASLHVIHVGDSGEVSASTIFESAMMQELLDSLHPHYHFITDESVEDGIRDFCISNNIDLLLTFPREYGFLQDLFHKSVTKQLILTAEIPIVILHPNK